MADRGLCVTVSEDRCKTPATRCWVRKDNLEVLFGRGRTQISLFIAQANGKWDHTLCYDYFGRASGRCVTIYRRIKLGRQQRQRGHCRAAGRLRGTPRLWPGCAGERGRVWHGRREGGTEQSWTAQGSEGPTEAQQFCL